jgi:O-antigen/teichoic acid export membrane protein
MSDSSGTDASLTRIVRNSAFNAVGTALILPFNFIALFTLARRLGTASLGVFFTVFAICAVIHWIADAGTTTVLTRRVARFPGELRSIVAEATGLLLVVCMASVTMLFAVSLPWLAVAGIDLPWSVLCVAAVAMASRHALDFASNVFRGLERFEFENLARIVQTASFCLFVWIGVHPTDGGTLAAFIAFAASNVIAALLIWIILWRKWQCVGLRLNRTVVRDWLTESMPLGFGDVIRQLLLQLDTLLLAMFRPASVVGLFSIASRPLQPLQLLPRIIASVTFPMMSRTAHVDRATLSRTFAHTTSLLWSASLPICVIVTACATPLILATAGPEFVDAAEPLQLLIWASVLIFVNAQLRFVLTALDAERRYWRLITGVLVVKVVAGVILITMWGLYGACYANLLGEVVLCVAGLLVLRTMDVHGPALSQLARAIPGAVAMSAVLGVTIAERSSFPAMIAAIALSAAVYAAACISCGAWPWSDVMRVWQAVRRPATSPTSLVDTERSPGAEVTEVVAS